MHYSKAVIPPQFKAVDPKQLLQSSIDTWEHQRKLLAAKSEPRKDPLPGDGVCTTSEQYHSMTARSRGLWQILIDDVRRSPVDPNIGDQLIQLVKNVPAFPVTLPEQLSILNSYFLMAKCESEWLTTIDTECDRPVKKMRHYHTLGLPHPVIYQLPEPDGIALKAPQSGDNQPSILQLIFAWSYIFCGRWVEALKSTGADAQLLQHEEINAQNFWDFIRKQQWQAIVTYGDAVYFAPWSLAESGHGIW